MARIRTVKPEFWTDAKTGTLSELSKCLFIGMLNHCDDYGVLEWSTPEWKVKIFPYSLSTHGVLTEVICKEFLPRGLLTIFDRTVSDGEIKRYVFIRNFDKHQVINRPSKPVLSDWRKSDTPASYARRLGEKYSDVTALLMDDSVSAHGVFTDHSSPEGKGREGKGKGKETYQEEGFLVNEDGVVCER